MKQNMLGRAIAIAAFAHEDHKDKGGRAYILHPMRVMMRLNTDDAELMQIAILHDVIEDSDWEIYDLKKEGFSDRVLLALEFLTHEDGIEYDNYIGNICNNHDAMRVKLEDLKDNSDVTRLKSTKDKDLLRIMKYHRAFLKLKGELK